MKAALAARQCSVSAASFSEGSLILRYGGAVTAGAARRWADRVVTLVRLERKATPEASEVPNSRLKRSID